MALPSIRHDLDASVADLQWTVDAYALVLAAFLVLSGSTADRVGRKRVFQTGLVVFGIGSLLCGLAPGVGWLIAARVVQAVGGTMLNPVAMAIIATVFTDPAERARAVGVFAAMSGLSLALGPVAGGILVNSLGWQSIFWVNGPIVVAVLIATTRFVPESRAARPRRFDPVGQFFTVLVLGGAVFAIIESHRIGWGSPYILALLVAAVTGVVGLIVYEPRRADPLLELRLFRSVPFSAAIIMAVLAFFAFGAFMFVTTLYLQDVRHLSPLAAGLCLIPLGALIIVTAPVSGRIVATRGPRPPLVLAGATLVLVGLGSLALGATTPLAASIGLYVLFGVFQGSVNPPMTNTALSGMPRSMAGVATSLTSAGRQTGIALGVAVAGTVVAATDAGPAFVTTARGVWWLLVGLGVAIVALALLSTGKWAATTADRAARQFDHDR